MLTQVRAAVVALLALTIVTGLAYPLLVTAVAHAVLPEPARGSIVSEGGSEVGSRLIGQPFDGPSYFWGRLSATTDANGKPLPYNGASSAGSNLGPTNPALVDEVRARVEALRSADPGNDAPVPVDLVTSSGSGLDPDISPAAAEYQIPRVARTRHLDAGRVRALVAAHTIGRTFGFLGEPRVNVLECNLALERER